MAISILLIVAFAQREIYEATSEAVTESATFPDEDHQLKLGPSDYRPTGNLQDGHFLIKVSIILQSFHLNSNKTHFQKLKHY